MGRVGRHECLRIEVAGAVADEIAHLMQIQNCLIVRVCLGDVREAGLWSGLVDPCVFRDVYGMDRTGNQQIDGQNQAPDSQALQDMWLGFNRSSSPFCFLPGCLWQQGCSEETEHWRV